ncbi:unnamed protein product, partial [Polarella glacialis]
MGDAFVVRRLAGRGRGVVATRRLAAGEAVLLEEPWAVVLLADELGSRCDFSLRPCDKLLRCASTGLCFSSQEDQKAAASLYYKAEQLAAAAVAAKGAGKGVAGAKPAAALSRRPAPLRLALRALHRGGLAGGEHPWTGLESHWEDLNADKEEALEQEAARCLDVVAAGLGLFAEDAGDEANRAFQLLADVKHVAHLLAALDINAMTVTDEEQRDIGLGLYLKGACLNHDDEPNCVQSFVGRQLVVRTCRPVEEGQELTIAYAELAELSSV